jgi:hypothetical protein
LLVLNQESWLVAVANSDVWLVLIDGLPPKPIERRLVEPSSNAELTSTEPLGRVTYGSLQLREPLTPSCDSLRKMLWT